MAHQDQGRRGAARICADDLFQALRWITAKVKWSEICLRKDCTWTARALVWAAVLWAWSDEKTLGDRFATVPKITRRGFARQDEPATSYQAFAKLLCRWTPTRLALLSQAFRTRMQQSLASVWTVAGWFVLAGDGSRIDVPRTRANEERYSPKSKLSREGKKRRLFTHQQNESRLPPQETRTSGRPPNHPYRHPIALHVGPFRR